MFNPVFLALVANSAGLHVYGTPPASDSDEGNKVPRIIFATGVCVLFAYCRLFENLFCRPSPKPFQFIWKYLAVAYILEQLIVSMWIPIEKMVSTEIPALADSMEKSCEESGSLLSCAIFRLLDVFVLLCATNVLPVVLATVFLLCSLHMTDLVDVRILKCGPRRLIALVIQYLMRIVGIKSLVCEEDVTKLCRPTGNGCGASGAAPAGPGPGPHPGAAKPPCRKPPARAPTPNRR